MELKLVRVANKKKSNNGGYCIGHLYIDGEYYCDTIEDIDRGMCQDWELSRIYATKIKSKTAIPTGTYIIYMNRKSPKFSQKSYSQGYYYYYCGGYMPYISRVPGYEGILMHRGSDENWSAGCLILGYNKVVGKVVDSKNAFEKVYSKLKSAKDKITITITRKYNV